MNNKRKTATPTTMVRINAKTRELLEEFQDHSGLSFAEIIYEGLKLLKAESYRL